MQIPDITQFVFQGAGILIFKIPLLLLLGIYVLFTFIVINRIKAFNRIVNIAASHASSSLQALALIQFVLALSLFLLAIVIV
jgi:hypothetical protein